MASLIESTWSNATLLIETQDGRGTGFLVGRPSGENEWRIFIVTNKHVIDEDASKRQAMTSVRLHINVNDAGTIVGNVVDYPLVINSDHIWREHADSDIDVLAINAVPLFKLLNNIANKFVPEDQFAVASKRQELDITAGEEIVVVGYPSGIRQGKTNSPVIRQGIIATRIGEELHEEESDGSGGVKIRISRGFLIDGGTIPGSSGSPVILKPVTGRHIGKDIVMGTAPPVLLGIVAETRFAPINAGNEIIPGFAGLGLAFDVETIVEVLNLF